MRYPKDHKDASRQRLIELSGSHAKKHGFNESGMASLAASAGVTTGALYKHFDGKADLFAAVITAELERTAKMYDGFDPADDASVAKITGGLPQPPARETPGARLPVAVAHARNCAC